MADAEFLIPPLDGEAARRRTEAVGPNQVWTMDFVHDQLATGKKLRLLIVVDTFSRYVPVLKTRHSYRGEDVAGRSTGLGGRISGLHNATLSGPRSGADTPIATVLSEAVSWRGTMIGD